MHLVDDSFSLSSRRPGRRDCRRLRRGCRGAHLQRHAEQRRRGAGAERRGHGHGAGVDQPRNEASRRHQLGERRSERVRDHRPALAHPYRAGWLGRTDPRAPVHDPGKHGRQRINERLRDHATSPRPSWLQSSRIAGELLRQCPQRADPARSDPSAAWASCPLQKVPSGPRRPPRPVPLPALDGRGGSVRRDSGGWPSGAPLRKRGSMILAP